MAVKPEAEYRIQEDELNIVEAGVALAASVVNIFGIAGMISEELYLLRLRQEIKGKKQLDLVRPEQAVTALWRDSKHVGNVTDTLFKQGLSQTQIEILRDGIRPMLTPFQLRDAYYRSDKKLADPDRELAKLGFVPSDIQTIKTIFPYYPPPTDLIRFAVREVYSPTLRSEFGLDQEFPSEFSSAAAKIGMDTDTAKNYWAAHWILPSVGQGYDMLHRGEITKDQLKRLLRMQDVMPFWRDKLINIAYSVPTRIDIRRLRRAGVYKSVDDVTKAYIRLGYNPKDALDLAKMTESEYITEERDLTKSEVINVYKRDPKKKQWAVDTLLDMGYTEEDAALLLSVAIAQEKARERDLSQGQITSAYKKGIMTKEIAKNKLVQLGYDTAESDYLLKLAEYRAPDDIKLLPFGLVRTLFREGYMDVQYFVNYLYYLGYSEEDIRIVGNYEWDRKKVKS